MRALLSVVTSEQSAACDAAAIAAGTPSRALMQRAGAAAAGEIALRRADLLGRGALVFAGPGNNGGDGWVVARALAAAGVRVRVVEPIAAKTPDAAAERELALSLIERVEWNDADVARTARDAALVVDGLLGTGSSGTPRGAIAAAVQAIAGARAEGAFVVALDLPTGVDATTGADEGAVRADLTLTFGTVKRGHLVARDACGEIVVVDIGLGAAASAGTARLVDERWVGAHVAPFAASSHKGIRKKLGIVGGGRGMAGAAVLAARAAIRSGIGMTKLVVAEPSLAVVQGSEPLALAAAWPTDADAVERDVCAWADALVIGPGLGRSGETRALVDRVLARFRGPVLLDADALNVFDGDLDALRASLGSRGALLTPHPAELARLMRTTVGDVLARRFEIGAEAARRTGAAVLLKGVPTVISAPNGETLVSATGTPALAAAGSGDLLSGIAGTLLAQSGDPLAAGAAAAWVHGQAARRATPGDRTARGITLDDVLDALSSGWRFGNRPTRYPVLLELPAVTDAGAP